MTSAPENLTRRDARVDAFIAALPAWQQDICAVPDDPLEFCG